MSKIMIISTLILISLPGFAQTFDRLKDNNLWNRGQNVTGISQDKQSFSNAEIYGGYKAGDFIDYGKAISEWNAGISTESIRHIGKFAFIGQFAFEQSQGHDMYGSIFVNPGRYPIDILEFTPGNKNLQKYSVNGGFSYDVSDNWRIGVMLDFDAANYAKRKDLRHTNFMLDFSISPGFMWHNQDLALGGSVNISKNAETIKSEVVGTAESTYYAFFDKGLMYGLYEGWEGSGIHLKGAINSLPVKEIVTGTAFQLSYKGFFTEIGYNYSKGRVGEMEHQWYEFPANSFFAHLSYRQASHLGSHFIRLSFNGKNLSNRENIIEVVSKNGVNTVINHGFNTILKRNFYSICPEYEYVGKIWEIKWWANGELDNRVSTQMYPLAIQQNINKMQTYISSIFHLGKFDISAKIGFQKGWFDEKENFSTGVGGDISKPDRIDEYYNHSISYLEASKFDAYLMGRWKFYKGLYIKIQGGCLTNLNTIVDLGKIQWNVGISIGYDF